MSSSIRWPIWFMACCCWHKVANFCFAICIFTLHIQTSHYIYKNIRHIPTCIRQHPRTNICCGSFCGVVVAQRSHPSVFLHEQFPNTHTFSITLTTIYQHVYFYLHTPISASARWVVGIHARCCCNEVANFRFTSCPTPDPNRCDLRVETTNIISELSTKKIAQQNLSKVLLPDKRLYSWNLKEKCRFVPIILLLLRTAVIWWQRGQNSDLIDVGLILDEFVLWLLDKFSYFMWQQFWRKYVVILCSYFIQFFYVVILCSILCSYFM